uniref:Uncharacterized protein n=1 Tax=Nelumbo nucifera TaxID=4432 RepID=A0A822ZC03_NELNU|nr:TPA_asm: hypothetical protein HUJ06_015534 [Nelumbo nucifera]
MGESGLNHVDFVVEKPIAALQGC